MFSHFLSGFMSMSLYIQVPKPAKSLLECFLQFLLVVSNSFQAQAKEVSILLAAGDHPLASRPSDFVVCFECRLDITDQAHSGITKKFCQYKRIFNGLPGSSALVWCRGVCGISEDGHSRS